MIAYLSGTIQKVFENKIILVDKIGVGREVFFSGYGEIGNDLELYTSHIFRENLQWIFGFKEFEDKELFEDLLGVTGVGPKTAMGLMSRLGRDELFAAVLSEDLKTLKEAPGIGAKSAKQIILDLKSKFEKRNISFTAKLSDNGSSSIVEDTHLALAGLGFSASEYNSQINELLKIKEYTKTDDLVRDVLMLKGKS